MRAVLVLVLLGCIVGCRVVGEPIPPGDDDAGSDPGVPFDPPSGCRTDDACPIGQVCARVGGCTPADQVRSVHVFWTLSGRAANRTTCASTPDLAIRFSTADDAELGPGYAPVPCSQGKFTIDKLPMIYSQASLRITHGDDWRTGMLDPVTGELTLDLPF